MMTDHSDYKQRFDAAMERLMAALGVGIFDAVAAEPAEQEIGKIVDEMVASIPRWISVAERLPEEGRKVWCFGDGEQFKGWWKMQRIVNCPERRIWYVDTMSLDADTHTDESWVEATHWMPLPEPPIN
jgi:hypothetical protein